MQQPPQWHSAPPPRSNSTNVVLIVVLVFVGVVAICCGGGIFYVWKTVGKSVGDVGAAASCYSLTSSGDFKGAIPPCRELVAREPDSGEAHNDLGWDLTLDGQLPEGLVEIRKAVELKPDRTIYDSLAMALALSGQGKEAMKVEKEHVLVNGEVQDDAERVTLGMVYYANGLRAKAHEQWEKAKGSPDATVRRLAVDFEAKHP